MAVVIAVADGTFSKTRVDEFCRRLQTDPQGASYFAAALFGAQGLVPVRTTALRAGFDRLSPWEKAGVIDEVRDILDKQLGHAFEVAVSIAQREGGPAGGPAQ